MSPALREPLPPQSTSTACPPEISAVDEPCPTSSAVTVRSARSVSSLPSPMAAHSRTASPQTETRGRFGRTFPANAAARARYTAASQITQYRLSVLSEAKGNFPSISAIHRA